jgi:transposase InsO family protein
VGSESTIYRTLRAEGQMSHRQSSRPPRAGSRAPREHVATGPDQVWSWDITYLDSLVRGVYFYLYLILDVWSRKIVGAKVYAEESGEHAARLFQATCRELELDPEGLTLHQDNGSPMKAATFQATLQRLGVAASFSRPRVSNDNPYSEALFRTLKYRPEYPSCPFPSVEASQAWVDRFVAWYNTEHLHSAVRFVTPEDRHQGRDREILARRRRVYEKARHRHPERWSGSIRNWEPVRTVYLNPEKKEVSS